MRMLQVIRRRTLECLLLTVSVWGVGCGDAAIPTGSVSGTLEANGEPKGDVQLILLSLETGQGGSADVSPDGSFDFPQEIQVGNYVAYLAPKAAEPSADGQPASVSMDTKIPDKYWNESTSDLSVEVKEGENKVGLVIE